jgi:hypothetical protein
MEINLWHFLWQEGGLHLKQRIPEVCLFHGSRLEAWYYSNSSGLLCRRTASSLEDILSRFLSAASRSVNGVASARQVSQSTPVAILRKPSPLFEGREGQPISAHATVLTAKDLTELIQRVQAGLEDADTWSIQNLVEPMEDTRIISVYSCNAKGEEQSDIFGRTFHKVYPLDGKIFITTPEQVAADRCSAVLPTRRAALEAKTLSMVRFASRFHGIHFDGLVLEFIFDCQGHPVLHGCWNLSQFGDEPRRQPVDPEPGRCKATPSYPVPTVGPAHDDGVWNSAMFRGTEKDSFRETTDVYSPHTSHMASVEIAEDDTPDGDVDEFFENLANKGPGGSRPGSAGPGKMELTAMPVLVEVWSGELFLGEAILPTTAGAQTLRLQESRPEGTGTRHDPRKKSQAPPSGTLTVDIAWDPEASKANTAIMKFQLLRGEGLQPPGGHGLLCPRALLWLQKPDNGWQPLWTSNEVKNACNPQWKEKVNLNLPLAETWQPQPPASRYPSGPGASKSPRTPKRPVSARARLEESSVGESRSQPRSRPVSARSEGRSVIHGPHSPRDTSPSTERPPIHGDRAAPHQVIIEPQTSVKSPRQLVGGAELKEHWGVDESGTLSTHMLAHQVLKRFSSQKSSRSNMLAQMSAQLERYRNLQLAWGEQCDAAKAVVAKADEELQRKEEEVIKISGETRRLEDEYRTKMAQMCQSMMQQLDMDRIQGVKDTNVHAESKQRIQEQRRMTEKLEERNEAMRITLEKTMKKLNEVQSCYTTAKAEHSQFEATHNRYSEQAPELTRALNRVQTLAAQREQAEAELGGFRGQLRKHQDDLAKERSHSRKLEDFIRRIAMGPSASIRTGGGYCLDARAKQEAAALIREAARIGPPPPDYRYPDDKDRLSRIG